MNRFTSCLFLLVCASGCIPIEDEREGAGVTLECSKTETGGAALECSIVELVNQRRAQGAVCNGAQMPPAGALAINSILQQTARAHAADMAANHYFAHENLSGQSAFDRIGAAGYTFSTAAENIAAGNPSPEETMQQWMTSTTGHCENIMNPDFAHIGVGYAYSESHEYEHLWVQNFGTPL